MSAAVRRTAGDDPVALALVAAMLAELGDLYDADLGPITEAKPEELSPPGGGFVVLHEHGEPVAGGGVRRLDERACEIKRMYVVPEARGRGLGVALLRTLEALARDLGYAVARLDTGPEQPGARRMYVRAGYMAVPDYNGNPYATFWGEKALTAPAAAS
jgi:GNAT superfamily N-acetyltransferase